MPAQSTQSAAAWRAAAHAAERGGIHFRPAIIGTLPWVPHISHACVGASGSVKAGELLLITIK